MPDLSLIGLGGLAVALSTLGAGTVAKAYARRAGRGVLLGMGLLGFAAGLAVAAVAATLALLRG